MATFGAPIGAPVGVCLASATVAHLTDDFMAEQTQVGVFFQVWRYLLIFQTICLIEIVITQQINNDLLSHGLISKLYHPA